MQTTPGSFLIKQQRIAEQKTTIMKAHKTAKQNIEDLNNLLFHLKKNGNINTQKLEEKLNSEKERAKTLLKDWITIWFELKNNANHYEYGISLKKINDAEDIAYSFIKETEAESNKSKIKKLMEKLFIKIKQK